MPPRKKNAPAKTLEQSLWESAEGLRSSMEAAEYKHVVLGLIFLKYISDNFTARRAQLERLVNDKSSDYFMPTEAAKLSVLEDRDEYLAENVFWVPEGHRWEDLRSAAKQADIGVRVDSAMDAIEKENPSLRGVLPKNYARKELTPEALGGLIDTFSRQDLAAEEHKGLDVLGRVYEYFLREFASGESKGGKRGGQFYTPRSIVQLMVEMLQPYKGRVYDPACGSGGMFVQADKFVTAHGGTHNDLSVFGQESVATTWRLGKMNLALRGIEANLGEEWGDTFGSDQHPDLRADYIIANPPFNMKDWGGERLVGDPRWKYGDPTRAKANYAWLQHMLARLAPTGTIATLLANGSLTSEENGEDVIRKNLVEGDVVECIVALPEKLFYGTTIPVALWMLTPNKKGIPNGHLTRPRERETLFIDARKLGHMQARTVRAFSEDDILKIADTYHAWRGTDTSDGKPYEDIEGFCRSVVNSDIAANDYKLTPGRFVGSEAVEEDGEALEEKISRLTDQLCVQFKKRADVQQKVLAGLESLGVADE